MGVSSTRVGDHRGSARTVQYLSKKSYDGEWSEVRTIWGPPTLGRFRGTGALCCVSPLSPLSSLLSLPSLDHFSLSLSSRLGLVILGWQWSASPGVVRFHPASPLLIVSPPPLTRVWTCLLFQVSSFKLLGLEYPPVLLSLPAPRSLEYLEPLCWDTLLIASPLPPSPFCVV